MSEYIKVALIFILRFTVLLFSQSRNPSPKIRLFNKIWWHRFDERTKQASATSKKGVVGKTGKITPSTPITTNIQPKIINNIRFTALIPQYLNRKITKNHKKPQLHSHLFLSLYITYCKPKGPIITYLQLTTLYL